MPFNITSVLVELLKVIGKMQNPNVWGYFCESSR